MNKITQAVILAGGKGTRLLPYTLTTPKPMIEINGKPFLEYIIEDLKSNGITEIIILVGYMHGKIENYFGDGTKFGLSIRYSYSPVEIDTGSRLKNAFSLLQNTFLLLYGDNIWPLNLQDLENAYQQGRKDVLMTVYNNRDKSTKNNVFVKDCSVVFYSHDRKEKELNGVNIGYFIFKKNILNDTSEENFSLDVIIDHLVKDNQFTVYTTNHKYYSLTSSERLPAVEKYLSPRKIVFLDRDGVINKKAPKAEYITKWEDFIFLPQVREAFTLLKKKEYEIYIITNQSGIARGKLSKEALEEMHGNLIKELAKAGITIQHIYICPHGWDENCWCRKPSPGMLFKASYDYKINLFKSIFIGDDERDGMAGITAGCKTYLVTPEQNLFDIVDKYL